MRYLGRLGGAAMLLIAACFIGSCAGAPPEGAHNNSARVGEGRIVQTVVAPPSAVAPPTPAQQRLATMTLRDQAATIVMGHLPSQSPDALSAYMAEPRLGGFLLMGDNIPDPGDDVAASERELRRLTRALVHDARLPPLIAIDQEGGVVSRLPWDEHASPRILRAAEPDAAEAAFRGRSRLLARAGANVNFGIVADFTADADSFIASRVLGETAEDSARRVAAAVAGERGTVASTLKHFPGHGASSADTHQVIPGIAMPLEQWRRDEATPFVAGIEAGAELVMLGHLTFRDIDGLPASLSPRWHAILREDLGFTGVTVTDDLGMLQNTGLADYQDPVANAVAAVAAGSDLVLIVMHSDARTATRVVDGIVAAVESGALPGERVAEAAERVIALRLRLARR